MKNSEFLIFFLFPCQLFAQHPCGTNSSNFWQPLPSDFRLEKVWQDTMLRFPVSLHIASPTHGSTSIALSRVMNAFSYLNATYRQRNVQFYLCGTPRTIFSDSLYTFHDKKEDSLCTLYDQPSIINLYISESVEKGGKAVGGYAYMPDGTKLRIFLAYDNYTFNSAMVHEFGHFFGLLHTFEHSEDTSPALKELVTRGTGKNCTTAGDALCDTPADPFPFGSVDGNCVFSGTSKDANSASYSPDVYNFMSYYTSCASHFSTGQLDLIYQWANSTQRTKLTCGSAKLPSPTQLTATLLEDKVRLTWKYTAAAGTTTGFLIERTLSTDTNFTAIAFVPADSSGFTDWTVGSNQSYVYRIKPVNTLTSYSNTAKISTQLIYCTPAYDNTTCGNSPAISINSFKIGGKDSMNNVNNGCALYTEFTQHPITFHVKNTYPVEIDLSIKNLNYYQQYVTVWVDLNIDGTFSSSEILFQLKDSLSLKNILKGTITIPTSATAGKTRLRLRSRYAKEGIVDSPCDTYEYGETEDYPVSILMPVGLEDASLDASSVSLYPNPNQGTLYFSERVQLIQLYSTDGKMVLEQKEPPQTMDLSYLPNGYYIVKTFQDGWARSWPLQLLKN